jgi:hypothetical protein
LGNNGSINSHSPSSTSHGLRWATTTSRQKINYWQDQYHATKIILLAPLKQVVPKKKLADSCRCGAPRSCRVRET